MIRIHPYDDSISTVPVKQVKKVLIFLIFCPAFYLTAITLVLAADNELQNCQFKLFIFWTYIQYEDPVQHQQAGYTYDHTIFKRVNMAKEEKEGGEGNRQKGIYNILIVTLVKECRQRARQT